MHLGAKNNPQKNSNFASRKKTQPMRVLIINTSERIGGAAIAASRLMEALKNNGIKAKMLVRDKQTNQVTVVALKKSWRRIWQFLWERIVIWASNGFHRKKPVCRRHRQHRYRHHFPARVSPSGCHPSPLDKPRHAFIGRHQKNYKVGKAHRMDTA